jgi:hypothetical protein
MAQIIEEAVAERGQGLRSSFSQFQREAERIVMLKEGLQQLFLNLDPADDDMRSNYIKQCGIAFSELRELLTKEEIDEIDGAIDILRQADIAILTYKRYIEEQYIVNAQEYMQSQYDKFNATALRLIQLFIKSQIRTNTGLKAHTDKGEIERMYKIAEAPLWFKNPIGILISPQLETWCRNLYVRQHSGYDNIIIVSARRGKGKSTLTLAAGSTLSAMNHLPFNEIDNVVVSESREYVRNKLKAAPKYSTNILDQAGNQTSSKTWWVEDQAELINTLDIARFHFLTLFLNWHSKDMLDKDVRNNIATNIIEIDKRGLAIVKTYNLNTEAKGGTNKSFKNAVAITPEAASSINEYDSLKVISIPFYDIASTKEGKEFWARYEKRKEAGFTVSSLRGAASTKSSENYYVRFLIETDITDAPRISKRMLDGWGTQNHVALSVKSLSKLIAENTNQKLKDLYVIGDPLNPEDEYLVLNKYARVYIDELKAMKKGAEDNEDLRGLKV